MTTARKYLAELFFLSSLALLIVVLFAMKTAIMPFFIGSAVAYVSYPLFEFFQRLTRNRKRVSAILTIFTLLLLVLIAVFIILPTVITQVQSFIKFLPELIKKLDVFLYKFLGEHYLKQFNFHTSTFQTLIREIYSRLGSLPIGDIIQRLFSGVSSIFDVLLNIILAPLVTYYLLVNVRKIKKLYLSIAPANIREELNCLLTKVHDSLSSYLIGQMVVAVFVGFYIAIGLYFVGIKYCFLIGFVSGALNMAPYIGFFSGLVPAILLAIFDNGKLTYVVGVLIVFLTEVGIENLLYPVVMGKTTGINPLLVLLSIIVGGYYGGVLGIIIAVPVAIMVVPVFESIMKKREAE